MKLIPYLQFQGNCEKALQWYQSIFGGDIKLNRYSEAPMDIPENYKNKILHADFTFEDNTILACDSFPGGQISNSNGIAMTLQFTDEKQAEKIFNKLAEGGKITIPFQKQFWNAYFGQLEDRYGKLWMINSPQEE
ncbi:VOC family protein [Sinomicrobium weinanense]|uniref:VOC family protein n=1 Tax=Sinomicrobium weinanense TaxID=2842200 RepID=A0A926JRT9_9FLAO|nr:VOC family protein [Sinomicrobium weinanense]MBC9796107.1 VOC family protein [Sinomicrobium weinanense]MBU3124776.1 VOC family protein [Sinomicrobium weinanense]